jgi:hypothetical protein
MLHQVLPSAYSFRELASVMRRKAISLGSACLFLVCLVWLVRPILIEPGPYRVRYGSQYIFKGPHAEDKVIVMAQMEGENVDWVSEELQE